MREPRYQPFRGRVNWLDRSPLAKAHETSGYTMGDMTVGDKNADPFRLDTQSWHARGNWIGELLAEIDPSGTRTIHVRGLHYAAIGRTKPDGSTYANTDKNHGWMGQSVVAARWLGYVDFTRITDERSDEPEVIEWQPPSAPSPWVDIPGIDVADEIPVLPTDLSPRAMVDAFVGAQPYHLVLVGEKTSLRDVLGELAQRVGADLYLPNGRISLAHIHRMAENADADGRPMVVVYFADFDPAGWTMPATLTRRLQALREVEFPDIEYRVYRAALELDQVIELGLPDSVMKEGDGTTKARWIEQMGREQVEIDALATLQPDVLIEIAQKAIAPFFDPTLALRVQRARQQWQERAQAALDAYIGPDGVERRQQAQERIAELNDQMEQIAEEARELITSTEDDIVGIEWPEIDVPAAEIDELSAPESLGDSEWSFADQTLRLQQTMRFEDH